MSDYQALALQYRPRTFGEVIGQRVAVSKLEGALFSNKIPRTIIISGPYGSGKTTLARIIARYVNCLKHAPKGNCISKGETELCRCCKLMDSEPSPSHPDYMELNAANARGIEDARQMIEMSYLAPQSNYRVFCIDEAQQLTPQAAQAFLKPFEEPPKKSIWIICTTAKEKILPTIVSRCFPADVGKITPEVCAKIVLKVSENEKVPLSPELCLKIAEAAHGHPRTALQGLESILAYVASKGTDDLESVLGDVLKDVIKQSPEVLVEKYVRQILDGSILALQNTAQVENHEYFLQLIQNTLNQLTLTMLGSERAEKYYQDFYTKTKWKKELSLKVFADIAKLNRVFMMAYKEAKSYTLDVDKVLDLATFEALAITQQWAPAPKT